MPIPILVDSTERISTSASSTDFSIDLKQSFSKIVKCRFDWSSIPLAIYQITSNNNIIYFNENSTDKQATLTPGYYNAVDLASEATSKITTASGGYATHTVTFNTSTFKYTLSSTQNVTYQWATGGPYLAFGFSNTNTNSATSHTSTQSVQLNSPLGVNIWIDPFNSVTYTGGNPFKGLFKINLPASLGSVSVYIPPTELSELFPETNIRILHIKLMDFRGNVIDINNHDWSMHLTCFTEDEVEGEPVAKKQKI